MKWYFGGNVFYILIIGCKIRTPVIYSLVKSWSCHPGVNQVYPFNKLCLSIAVARLRFPFLYSHFTKKHFPIIMITLSFSSTRNNIICCSLYLQDPQNIKFVVPNSLDYPRFRLPSQNVCTPFTLEVKPVSLALTLRALAQLVQIFPIMICSEIHSNNYKILQKYRSLRKEL